MLRRFRFACNCVPGLPESRTQLPILQPDICDCSTTFVCLWCNEDTYTIDHSLLYIMLMVHLLIFGNTDLNRYNAFVYILNIMSTIDYFINNSC